jgi:hypothetical protein
MSEDGKSDSFLNRWSDRKLGQETETDGVSDEPISAPTDEQTDTPSEDAEPKSIPVWQQPDADPETKKEALRAILRKPEHDILDGLNEYDEDFTQFASLGNIVTHEMKRVARWVGDELNEDLPPPGSETEQQEQTEQAKEPENTENKEGEDRA